MIDQSRLDGLLFAMLGDHKLVSRWWSRPNKNMDGRCPQEVFAYDPERVRDFIFQSANLDLPS